MYASVFALFLASATAGCAKSRTATPGGDDAQQPRAASFAGIGPTMTVSAKSLRGMEDGVLRIWPMGDSITEGVEGGYRNELYRRLRKDGINFDFVGTMRDDSTKVADKDHEGHPGFTLANAEENVEQWLKQVKSPDVILMMLGTNDFAWWTNKSVLDHYGDFTTLLNHLLNKLPSAIVVVATIPPQSPALIEDVKRDRGVMTTEFNEMLRKSLPTHEAYGKRVYLADIAPKLSVKDLSDGIHPSAKAHVRIGDGFYATMMQALKR
jgi:lysophospholipase L1-like esterase